jgi:hypothetical protein
MDIKIIEDKKTRKVRSKIYNYDFNKENGLFIRWGKNIEDDPLIAPAPEILDLEISEGGQCLGNCAFCYKGNGGNSPIHNLSFNDFKTIFHKLPKTLTQIAFGIMNISTNPDFFKMMEYSRENGVIPNYTCHGLDVSDEYAKRTSELCGAVAVSVYNKEKSYDSIKKFTDNGMTQVNIHFMIAQETYDRAFEIVDDIATDPRLSKMNAIVFLQLKKKGRGENGFNYIGSVDKYKKLINYCEEKKVRYGFDSCSAPLYFKSMEGTKEYKLATVIGEPCESSCFSSYINCYGDFFPCSFAEGEGDWKEGLSVLNCNDFVKDVWMNEKVKKFRHSLIHSSDVCTNCVSQKYCRSCPIYEGVAGCKTT